MVVNDSFETDTKRRKRSDIILAFVRVRIYCLLLRVLVIPVGSESASLRSVRIENVRENRIGMAVVLLLLDLGLLFSRQYGSCRSLHAQTGNGDDFESEVARVELHFHLSL